MLSDRPSAVSLLREAWGIDPQSKEAAAAFRRLGYRKAGEDWEEVRPGGSRPAEAAAGAPKRPIRPTSRPTASAT